MENLLNQANLSDTPMNRPLTTWRNIRVGEMTLARRLHCFILKTPMLQSWPHYKQWVRSRGISDHSNIYLEIFGPRIKPKDPFKFNSSWLQDPSYTKLVLYFWLKNPPTQCLTWAKGFYHSLLHLKKLTIKWENEKTKRYDHTLASTEFSLVHFMDDQSRGFLNTEAKWQLIELENERAGLLKEREETWRLKSRALWLKARDENTSYFKKISKGRKASNTI